MSVAAAERLRVDLIELFRLAEDPAFARDSFDWLNLSTHVWLGLRRAAAAESQRKPEVEAPLCTRCEQPLGHRAFRAATVDGERHDPFCPEPRVTIVPPYEPAGAHASRPVRDEFDQRTDFDASEHERPPKAGGAA